VKIEIELDTLYIDFPKGFEKEEEKLLVLEKEEEIGSTKPEGGNLETQE
jgi:hypothetical protein